MKLLVVLVRTHSPGNLGAAARVVKNFGASLALVAPRTDPAHPDARAFASGAEDLLDDAPRLGTLSEIDKKADLVVALTSLRGRGNAGLPPALTWPALRARQSEQKSTALVFGPERGGLTTEELRLCGARLSIPASSDFPTLNLAQAVAVSLALAAPRGGRKSVTMDTASAREMAELLKSFRAALSSAGFPGKGRSEAVVAEMESFLRRGRPSSREVALLLGALAALRRGL